MELIFEIVSYHRLSPEQISKKSVTSTMTFGRSQESDWHLPDPEKVVSSVHARVEKQLNNFNIIDLSTNGLYINRASEALGKENSHKLCHGDLLTFGDYEINVRLVQEQAIQQTTQVPISSKPITQAILTQDLLTEVVSTPPANELPQIDLEEHFSIPSSAIPEEWDINLLNNATANVADNQNSAELPTLEIKAHSENSTSINAFIKGLGISKHVQPNELSEELLFELGQAMRFLLMGLIDSLRARTSLKNEFRINQTTFQQQENNPLKFSASIDDIFKNLFLHQSNSFLSSHKAIVEAFNDTKKHDIALTAGIFGAVEGLLLQLSPETISSKDFNISLIDKILPGKQQARYWKLFQYLHQDLLNELKNQGTHIFSDDFVSAYDQKIKSL